MSTVTVWHPGVVLSPAELTPAIIAAIKVELTSAQTLALTCWREAEARLEDGRWIPNPADAMVDILEVIDYRAQDQRWRQFGHKGVCLHRRQFSCWEPEGGRDNFEAAMHAAQRMLAGVQPTGKLLDCLAAAEACLAGSLVHTLPIKTTHYFAGWMLAWPRWAVGHQPVARRWGHVFFNDIR